MRKQCVPGSFLSAHALEPGNEATPSPTALLRMCTVSHLLTPHAHPALTITTVQHSLSTQKKLIYILPPTLLWCSCQVSMFLTQISQLPMYPG